MECGYSCATMGSAMKCSIEKRVWIGKIPYMCTGLISISPDNEAKAMHGLLHLRPSHSVISITNSAPSHRFHITTSLSTKKLGQVLMCISAGAKRVDSNTSLQSKTPLRG